jgi:hypothetical protein
MRVAIIQFAAALITDAPKFTMGSKRRALAAVVALALPLIAYFGWLYYREWKMKRDFRRYWEGKARRSVD